MALLTCRDLCLGYEGKEILHGLNFAVEQGDYLCIVGENGSGKSTLMKALLGLIKPVEGYIKFGDGLKQNEIGYLPQQTEIQRDFPASVAEVVLSGTLNRAKISPFYSPEAKAAAKANMELLDITGISKKCYNALSGGQQQRVLLARALCASGKLLLLDEPVAGLDPVVTAELYRVIRTLNRDKGVTVVMVSHDIAAVTQDATHILHLHHKPLYFGSAQGYFESPVSARFFAGRHD